MTDAGTREKPLQTKEHKGLTATTGSEEEAREVSSQSLGGSIALLTP